MNIMNQSISSQVASETEVLSRYEVMPADAAPPLSDIDRWKIAVEAAGYMASTKMLEDLLEACPDRNCADADYLEGFIAGRHSAVALAANDPAPEVDAQQLLLAI